MEFIHLSVVQEELARKFAEQGQGQGAEEDTPEDIDACDNDFLHPAYVPPGEEDDDNEEDDDEEAVEVVNL